MESQQEIRLISVWTVKPGSVHVKATDITCRMTLARFFKTFNWNFHVRLKADSQRCSSPVLVQISSDSMLSSAVDDDDVE